MTELARLQLRVEELEHAMTREGVSLQVLGMTGNEVRVSCTCGALLGLLDAMTCTIRFGYAKVYAYLPADTRIGLTCKRCRALVIIEQGQPVATIDPIAVARGWQAGQPLPDGLQAITR